MDFSHFFQWLYDTPLSAGLRNSAWIVPAIQCVHILAICFLVGAVLVSHLRIAGVFARNENLVMVARYYWHRIYIALCVLLASGALLIIAEPDRTLGKWIFWLKMGLVLTGLIASLATEKFVLSKSNVDGDGEVRVGAFRPLMWLMIAAWIGVIICGRWIAYIY